MFVFYTLHASHAFGCTSVIKTCKHIFATLCLHKFRVINPKNVHMSMQIPTTIFYCGVALRHCPAQYETGQFNISQGRCLVLQPFGICVWQRVFGAQNLKVCCISHKTFLSPSVSRCSLFPTAQSMFYSISHFP